MTPAAAESSSPARRTEELPVVVAAAVVVEADNCRAWPTRRSVVVAAAAAAAAVGAAEDSSRSWTVGNLAVVAELANCHSWTVESRAEGNVEAAGPCRTAFLLAAEAGTTEPDKANPFASCSASAAAVAGPADQGRAGEPCEPVVAAEEARKCPASWA